MENLSGIFEVKVYVLNIKALKIVFLGTPEFAVGTLSALIEAEYNIVAVITAPDRKGGRGLKNIIESDVKKYALTQEIPVLQPTNLKSSKFLDELSSYQADLQIVVAFRMLPIAVWDMPRLGTYNLHGSLLPKFRGAAPINWAIMSGAQRTGVTTFKLRHEIDTGSIAFQDSIPINPGAYLDEVHDKLKDRGAALMVKTVEAICNGEIKLKEQDPSAISKAPKIFHVDCQLDLSNSVKDLFNKIRGLSPHPVAWVIWQEKKLKIYRATYSYDENDFEPGIFITDAKSFFAIACRDGLLFLTQVKAEGKRTMNIGDFLNGLQLKESSLPSQTQISKLWSW